MGPIWILIKFGKNLLVYFKLKETSKAIIYKSVIFKVSAKNAWIFPRYCRDPRSQDPDFLEQSESKTLLCIMHLTRSLCIFHLPKHLLYKTYLMYTISSFVAICLNTVFTSISNSPNKLFQNSKIFLVSKN